MLATILHLLQDYIHTTSVQQPIRINKRSGGIVRVDLGDSLSCIHEAQLKIGVLIK